MLFELILLISVPTDCTASTGFLSASESTALLSSIQSILSALKQQEQSSNKLNTTQQTFCEQSNSIYLQEISDSKGITNSNQEILNRDQPEVDTVKTQIFYKEKELAKYEDELRSTAEERQRQRQQWETEDSQYDKTVEGVIGASKVIAQLKYQEVEPVFIQESIEQYQDSLLTALDKTNKQEIKPTILSLVEITSTGDSDNIDEVINLLEHLKSELIGAKGVDASSETKDQDEYEQYSLSLKQTIEVTQRDLENLRDKKDRLQKVVNTAQDLLQQENESLETYEQLKEDQENLCRLWRELRERKASDRKEQETTLNSIVEILNNSVRGC